jgi:membrane-bound lytic murein transglycosylase F
MSEGAVSRYVAIAAGACATAATLAGCGMHGQSTSLTGVDQIRARHELRVVTLNLPTTYYLGANGPRGLEFELAKRFAADLAVNLDMHPVANESALREELASGRADIAAAQITDSMDWHGAGLAAKPYSRIPQLVVYRRDHVRPENTGQFASTKLAVRAGSPQEEILQTISQSVPHMRFLETAPDWADPLEDVDTGGADYAITDAREFSFSHQIYPAVQVAFALPTQRPVQWMVRPGARDLVDRVNAFFDQLSQSGQLAQLMQRETGDTRTFVYEESKEFQTLMQERLPRYRLWFQQASAETGLDWRLIAAVSYQESKWDPGAVSADDARGLMMLMDKTASRLGVKNSHDPQEAIFAGARYLAEIHDHMPEHIPEPDRTWFTIAAYNCGTGHVEDARELAARSGKSSDSWADVRVQLPLLQQERYSQAARYGYARGWEPVQMVDRVQRFLTLLEWQPGEGLTSQSTRVKQPDPAAATAAATATTTAPPPKVKAVPARTAKAAEQS